MSNVEMLEAYSRLKALRQNVPPHRVGSAFVNEFHGALDLLTKVSGLDLSNFRVPPSQVQPIAVAGNYLTGETDYSSDSFCDRDYLLMKVDGVLSMFELLMTQASTGKPAIGFNPKQA